MSLRIHEITVTSLMSGATFHDALADVRMTTSLARAIQKAERNAH